MKPWQAFEPPLETPRGTSEPYGLTCVLPHNYAMGTVCYRLSMGSLQQQVLTLKAWDIGA